MRCQYCGSTMLHPDTQHKQFATGKAVAGAVTFGLVGAAAGFIGKDTKGYRCGACGAFMEKAMDFSAEMSIDSAIREAESGRSRSLYDYFKRQYPNISANIPAQTAESAPVTVVQQIISETIKAAEPKIKRVCPPPSWQADCPVYVEAVMIKSGDGGDAVSLRAYNQSGKELRSVYYKAIAYDDTGDRLNEISCVYQGINIPAGQMLPTDKSFPLDTDLAYHIELICEKAAFAGDEVWRENDAPGINLPPQPQLTEDTFPHIKYLRSELKSKCDLPDDTSLYLPQEGDGYWQCVCGQPVLPGTKCPRCGAEMDAIKPLLSQQYLREVQLNAVKHRAAERAKITTAMYEKAHDEDQETVYKSVLDLVDSDNPELLRVAAKTLSIISDYKNSAELIENCKRRIEEIEAAEKERTEREAREKEEADRIAAEQEAKKKAKNRIIGIISGIAVVLMVAVALVVTQVIVPNNKYKAAETLYVDGDKLHAAYEFLQLGNYSDSHEKCMGIWSELTHRDTISTCRVGYVLDAITLGVTSEGTVIATGDMIGRDYSGWSDVIAVSAGYPYDIGLKSGGTVLFEDSSYGSMPEHLTNKIQGLRDVVAVSAGYKYVAILQANGKVTVIGEFERKSEVEAWTDIVAISAAKDDWILGLKVDGTVVAAGDSPPVDHISRGHNIVAIFAGEDHAVAIEKDGKVVASGNNYYGQCDVSDWTDIIDVAVGEDHTVGLKKDGTVVAVGDNRGGQCNVSDWTDIVAISAGSAHTIGLKKDGTLVAVGDNHYGQCNVSDWADIKMPDRVGSDS